MLGVSGASALDPILMAASPDREGFLGQEPAPRSSGRNHGLALLCVPQTEEVPLARPAVLPGLRLNPGAQSALPLRSAPPATCTARFVCVFLLSGKTGSHLLLTPQPPPHPPPHTIRLAGGLSAAGLPPLGGEEGGKAAPVLGSALPLSMSLGQVSQFPSKPALCPLELPTLPASFSLAPAVALHHHSPTA